MKKLIVTIFLMFLFETSYANTFEAEAGHFMKYDLSSALRPDLYKIDMAITELKQSDKWAPQLAFSVLSADEKSGYHLYISQYHKESNQLVAGLRVIEDGVVTGNRILKKGIAVGEFFRWDVLLGDDGRLLIGLRGEDEYLVSDSHSGRKVFVIVSGVVGHLGINESN